MHPAGSCYQWECVLTHPPQLCKSQWCGCTNLHAQSSLRERASNRKTTVQDPPHTDAGTPWERPSHGREGILSSSRSQGEAILAEPLGVMLALRICVDAFVRYVLMILDLNFVQFFFQPLKYSYFSFPVSWCGKLSDISVASLGWSLVSLNVLSLSYV